MLIGNVYSKYTFSCHHIFCETSFTRFMKNVYTSIDPITGGT